MIVIGPCILMRACIREGFVVGRGSSVLSITRGPQRSRFPFRVERSANPVEETAAGIEGAEAGRRQIVRGKAGNSGTHAGSRDTGINRTVGITPAMIPYVTS